MQPILTPANLFLSHWRLREGPDLFELIFAIILGCRYASWKKVPFATFVWKLGMGEILKKGVLYIQEHDAESKNKKNP